MTEATRALILGAAGRDFHNFNVVYRHDPRVRVVAFTATQIPGISGRRYPPSLAGPLYPRGIPIEDEEELEALIERERDASRRGGRRRGGSAQRRSRRTSPPACGCR